MIKFSSLFLGSFVCEALSPWEAIRSLGKNNFMLCEKPEEEKKKTKKKQ